MKFLRVKIIIPAILMLVCIIVFVSCETIEQTMMTPPVIEGATYVGVETCAACHLETVKNYKYTAHAKIEIAGEHERFSGQSCEACHGPGSLHVEAEGRGGKFIINPGKNPQACFQCHLEMQASFQLPHHHPVSDGKMSCSDCHDPHGANIFQPKGVMVTKVNDTCAHCHREQARPHVYEHEALREGCTVCHQVHGSINDKMLTERDNNLCLKCHAQVAAHGTTGSISIGGSDHTTRLGQGTCFSAGCHTAMHGSDINPHFRY